MTNRQSKGAVFLVVAGGLAAILLGVSAPAAQAQVSVTSFVALDNATYHYDFEVFNKTGVDVSVIDVVIPSTPGSTYIANAMAPPGYTISVDEGSGSLVFAEDTSTFTAGSIVDGFTFDSTMLIPAAGADGLDSNGNSFTANTLSVTVPETSTVTLLLSAAGAAALIAYRRRRPIAAAI